MNWFYDLKTVTKLFLSFGLLSAMLAVVGAVGLSAAAEANASATTAYDRDMHGVILALRADNERLMIARSYRQALLVGDERSKEAARREVDQEGREATRLLNELAPILLMQENRDRLQEALKELPEYIRLAQEGLAAPDHASVLAVTAQSSPLGLHIGELIGKLVDAKIELSRREQEQNGQRYARSRNTILAVTSIAVLLAIAFAVIGGATIGAPLEAAVGVLERVAAGDLSARLEIARKDEVGQMATALNRSLEAMRSTLSGVQDVAGQVAAAASQLAAAAEQISSGTQEQAASLEETAASLEEISSTVKQNADNAQQAAQLSSGSRDAAERGGRVVGAPWPP